MAKWKPIVLSLALCAGIPAAQEPTQEELKARASRVKEEEKAHLDSVRDAEETRRKALEDVGVEDVTVLGGAADPGRTMDVALLADGFTKDQQAAWNAISERVAANFATRPFDAHAARVRVHRVDLVSKASGFTTEEVAVDTALKGGLRAFPGGKLLTCDTQKALDIVAAAVPDADYILVVLNTNEQFVASANTGTFVLLSTSKAHQGSLVMHEFGHHFINLVDEYVDEKQSGTRPPPGALDRAWNATLQQNVYKAKWHHWNIPEAVFRGEKRGKKFEWEDNVRCYEGAATFPDNVYRAEELCHMQRGKGKEFCRVCTEASELGLYRFFPPIQSVSPVLTLQKLALNEFADFEVVPVTAGRVAWYLDGRRVDAKKAKVVEPKPKEPGPVRHQLRLKGSEFGEGTHQVTVTVATDTPRVHIDEGMLSSAYTWTVEVSAKGVAVKGPSAIPAEAGKPIEFTLAPADGAGPATWTLPLPPEGATFDAKTGAFAWTPTESQAGAWRLDFEMEDRGRFWTHAIPVTVSVAGRTSGAIPKVVFIANAPGREGEPIEFRLMAWDADADHLAWSAAALPEGARLDSNTGRFTWTPLIGQSGLRPIEFQVTDGKNTTKKTVACSVAAAPIFRGMFRLPPEKLPPCASAGEWMQFGLHVADAKALEASMERLNGAPGMVRLAEGIRLLRDSSPRVSAAALSAVKRVLADASAGSDEAARTWPLDHFFDEMPRRVWQFADRPEMLDGIAELCAAVKAIPQLPVARVKDAEALLADLQAIRDYNKERDTKTPKPPITDKKLK